MTGDEILIDLQRQINDLQRQVLRMETNESGWYYPAAPLTSSSWDGDARSTTAKTVIDLSAVFGVPANVQAVYVSALVRDSASAGNDYVMVLWSTNAASIGVYCYAERATNDKYASRTAIVPCDENGDIYFQIAASGAGTFDVILQVMGWLI
jgi:hypothetical protein